MKFFKSIILFFSISVFSYVLFWIFSIAFALMIQLYDESDTSEINLEFSHEVLISPLNDNHTFVDAKNNSYNNQQLHFLSKKNENVSYEYVSSRVSSFVETNEAPHIKVFEAIPKNESKLRKWSAKVLDSDFPNYEYVFYIPKGSVPPEFESDSN